MPIISIHSLPPTDPKKVSQMLAEVQSLGAKALGCPLNNIWIMFHPVATEHYMQNGNHIKHPMADSHPPIVFIKAQVD